MTKIQSIGYLISQYPAISHTFILREIKALEAQGFDIKPFSVNDPDRPEGQLTRDEKDAAERTFYIKRQGLSGVFIAFLSTLIRHPVGLMQGVMEVMRLAGAEPRRLMLHLAYLAEALLVGRELKLHGITHLHVHFATPAASVGLLVKVVFGHGFSFTLHGPDELYDVSRYSLSRKIHYADFVICISHYARSQLMRLSPPDQWRKFDVSRLGVDQNQFTLRDKEPPAETFEVLCVGRLTPAKGQHLLLEATASLIRSGRSLRVTLVGQGPDMTSLKARSHELGLNDVVTFTGALNQDEILAQYRKAHAFVLPSFAEGLPVVLMEAMALGIPCVTTHITGVPELIDNESDGLLTAPSDLEGLVKALMRLMDDPALRNDIAVKARSRVVAEYSLRGSVERLSHIFESRLSAA